MRIFNQNTKLCKPTMLFIGVTTHESFAIKIFDDWMKILGIDTELIGVNISLNSDANEYLDIVRFIKSQPLCLGALVTTHKVNIYKHSSHLFDLLPKSCVEFKEIGCIYKDHNGLRAEATDLFSVNDALYSFLPKNYYKNKSSDFCILGVGGSGLALAYRILTNINEKPQKLYLVDINKNRLKTVQNILQKYDSNGRMKICYLKNENADLIIQNLKEKSVIVNATGLGKDELGTPYSSHVQIPPGSYIWEFNYRGNLDFLKIANEQSKLKGLKVADGWVYFVHGWMQVISKVYNVRNISSYFNEFLIAANSKRIK